MIVNKMRAEREGAKLTCSSYDSPQGFEWGDNIIIGEIKQGNIKSAQSEGASYLHAFGIGR